MVCDLIRRSQTISLCVERVITSLSDSWMDARGGLLIKSRGVAGVRKGDVYVIKARVDRESPERSFHRSRM